MRDWKMVAPVGISLVLVLSVSSCADRKDGDGPFTVAEVCDGAFSGDSAKAIESLTPSGKYRSYASGGLDRVTKDLKRKYGEDGKSAPSLFCGISGVERGDIGAKINFNIYDPEYTDGDRTWYDRDVYAMGIYSVAGPRDASLYFECASPHIDGSVKEPAPIVGRLDQQRSLLEKDTRTLRDINMSILHAATLAVAKKLECENDGGLPAKVDLQVRHPAESDQDQDR
ncbi:MULTISPECIES: hypothetical protein [unclassified Streptomyces]|uniref:hypothetical protein n=1 Tax=unclassified Streptomyces TaxID=2593676 RepID=UPI002E772B73|nr:hypothetical protein [Streptomyces sp. JV176]MEE1804188.1 hypothetical protein [Streptomyces sp. JV176]